MVACAPRWRPATTRARRAAVPAGSTRWCARSRAGHVATYGQVAELAGIPGGARVAGAALKTSKPGRPAAVAARDRQGRQDCAAGSRSTIRSAPRSSASCSRTRASRSATPACVDLGAFGWLPAPRLQPDQAAAHRLDDGLGPGRSAELHHHAVDVELRGVIADAEAIRDQLVRQALGRAAARPGVSRSVSSPRPLPVSRRPALAGTRLSASAVSITVRPLRTAASAAWMPGPT